MPQGDKIRKAVAATPARGGATADPQLLTMGPNPSAGEAEVEFALPTAGEVSLSVYDAVGRNVRGLAQGSFAAGLHSIHWDGRDVSGRPAPSGLYFVRLEAGGRAITRKAVLAR